MKNFFSILTILFFCASGFTAEKPVFGDVTSDEFNSYFDAMTYVCKEKQIVKEFPEISSYLKKITKEVVLNGLRELDSMNPQLTMSIWRNVLKKRGVLEINCKPPYRGRKDDVAQLQTLRGTQIIEFENSELIFGWSKHYRMNLGETLHSCLVADFGGDKFNKSIELHALDFANQKLVYSVNIGAVTKEYCRQIIFHEFLHFAEADNLSTEVHNENKSIDFNVNKLDDVVYACSRTAFRYGSAAIWDVPCYTGCTIPARMSKSSWVKSCQTCLGAKDLSTGVIVTESPDDIGRCEKIYDEIPGLKPL
jgi:hypothetical protein